MTEQTVEIPTFQDTQVRLSVHRKPGSIVELEIEAFEPLAKEAYGIALKKVKKRVVLPGFRKGKAPDEVVSKNYTQEVDQEFEQALSDLSFRAAAKLSQIFPLNKDSRVTYKMKSRSLHGALLTLSFEVEPQIPAIDPSACRVKPVKRPVVNEDKIQETIRQIQFFFAAWTKVEGRPVQEGDFVLLDVDNIETTPPTTVFRGTRFEVTQKSMASWMYNLVLGKNVGDLLEGVSTPDQQATDQETLGEKKVSVKILALDTAELPSVDDAFVKQLGVETTQELKEKIERLLEKQADAHVRELEREQVTEFLLNECPFELPTSLIQKETQVRLEHLSKDREFVEYWKGLPAEKRQETLSKVHTQSEKAVRIFYLCRKILIDAQINISAEDVPASPTSPLEFLLSPQKMFPHDHNPQTEHAEAFARLVLEKAEDYILSKASKI